MKEKQHKEELKRIRQKCLNSKDPLRFIQYSNDEKSYMIERSFKQQHQIVTEYRDGTIEVETFKQQ
jgi:hypothetical protein